MDQQNFENGSDDDQDGNSVEDDPFVSEAPFPPLAANKFVIGKSPSAPKPRVITVRVSDDFFIAVARIPYKSDTQGHQSLPCWCFATYGLRKYDTKEVCLLLECLPDELAVPEHVLQYLALLEDYAKRGVKMVEGSFTRLGGDPFLDHTDIAGFVYVRARPSHSIDNLVVPSAPFLFAILVKTEELCWVEQRHFHRLMLRLGHQYRYYPFPLWCSRGRKPVYRGFHDSVVSTDQVACIPDVVTHCDTAGKMVTMYLPKSRHPEMLEMLKELSVEDLTALPFLTEISDVADGHMVFSPDAEQPQCITKHSGKPATIGVSFVVIAVPPKNLTETPNSGANHIEDGILTIVQRDQLKEVYEALKNRKDWTLKSDGFPLLGLSIKWVDKPVNEITDLWSSPIDGISMSKLETQKRTIPGAEGATNHQRCGIFLSDVILISNSQQLRVAGIQSSQLARLTTAISETVEAVLKPFWESSGLSGIQRIGLRFFVKPDLSHGIYSCGSQPGKVPINCSEALRRRLLKLEFPKVRRSVAVELTFQVSGRIQDHGSGQSSTEEKK